MKKKLLFLALLLVTGLSGFAQATAYPVPDINQCQNEVFDLTVQTPITLANQDPENFTVMYYLSWQDAEENVNPIANPQAFMITTGNIEQALYIRVTNNIDDSYDVTSFVIGMWGAPVLEQFDDITVCDGYVLPALAVGTYNTGPHGTGAMLAPGTVVNTSQTIYVFAQVDNCISEASFFVSVGSLGSFPVEPIYACSVDGTGFAEFDLEPGMANFWQIVPEATNISIYESYQDAFMGTNAIVDINNYQNNVAWQQIILYVRVETASCTYITELELVVSQCTDNTITGHVSIDPDGNGCGEGDPVGTGMFVYYIWGNYINYAYTDDEGNYTFYNVPNGDISVYVDTYYSTNFVSSPNYHTFVIDDEDIDGIDFCLAPPAPINDVAVYITPISAAQPGFSAQYALVIYNLGNTVANGTVNLEFNDTQLDFMTSWPAMTQNGSTLTATYSSLQPYGFQYIYLDFLVAMPGVVDLGDIISFNTNVTLTGGTDADLDNNTYHLDQIAVNSWDPNDINVREGEEISEAQADEYLHYTIRFQNMGNANAHNVKILTTLDANLDWSTFQPLTSSHDFQANRGGNGDAVEFRFNNIELAGSQVNEPESHGYVVYKIKPKANVTIGDSMSAQAGIYFDFNEVVTTNSITTTVMSTAGINDITANGFAMYPNPASSALTIGLKDFAGSAEVVIRDVLGKTIVKAGLQNATSTVDVSSLKAGIYLVSVSNAGKQLTQKLVIK